MTLWPNHSHVFCLFWTSSHRDFAQWKRSRVSARILTPLVAADGSTGPSMFQAMSSLAEKAWERIWWSSQGDLSKSKVHHCAHIVSNSLSAKLRLLIAASLTYFLMIFDVWCYFFNKAYQHRNAWFPVYICILYSGTKHNWLSGNMNLDNTTAKHQLPRDEDYSKKLSWHWRKFIGKKATPKGISAKSQSRISSKCLQKLPSLGGICEWARVQVQSQTQQTSSNTGVATIFRRLEWPWYCQMATGRVDACLPHTPRKQQVETLGDILRRWPGHSSFWPCNATTLSPVFTMFISCGSFGRN